MEQEIILLLLSIISLIVGAILEKYKLGRFKKPADIFLKSLSDGKITEEELDKIIKALAEVVDNDKSNTV